MMINNIFKIAKINSLINEANLIKFNSLLPLKIDVLEELFSNKYKLLVGKRVLETKSNIKLEVGESYWGVMKEDTRTKSISLSNLLKQPALLKKIKTLPSFDIATLDKIFLKESPKNEIKMIFLEHLANASSKEEFLTLASMVEAINNNIFTFVLNQNQKEAIFQFRARKKRAVLDKEEYMIDFYAAFLHLGPLKGEILLKDDEVSSNIFVYYENSYKFLKNQLKELDFHVKLYKKDSTIEPIFNPAPSLLDIKG